MSASPEMYPGFDYLHVGELGDATDAIVRAIDESTAPPAQQMVFKTKDRLPLTDFPIPAYDKVPFGRYLLGTVQFSSGCPYLCEFCDIPGLYGRQPRMKTPQQIVAELDCIFSQPNPPATLYFVDDNFIGNRKAAKEMLPHLVEWQKKHSYPVMFACEATLNISKQTDILELMKEANFVGMFVGIETPEADALNAMRKGHNNAVPMMESIKTLNSYGIEITSGIILGLDSETADTEQRLKDFIDLSQIPMLTINLLQALPKTPLWDRLARDGRLREDDSRESNVVFLRPHDEVVATWRRSIAYANDPEKLFDRFRYQVEATYANRKVTPAKGKLTWNNLRGGAVMAWRILIHLCLLSDFRKPFWRMTKHALRARADRRHDGRGVHGLSPDRVHPRGAARRPERLVLLDQEAHRPDGGCQAARPAGRTGRGLRSAPLRRGATIPAALRARCAPPRRVVSSGKACSAAPLRLRSARGP